MGKNNEVYDVIIIGGGTTGLFSAYYSGMRDMTTLLIESGSQLGGKVAQFLPEKFIYDIGGIPKITGDKLVENMKEQASMHQPTIVLNQWIESITKDTDGIFSLVSKQGLVYRGKTVIVAVGTGNFDPIQPDLDDISMYNQTSHHYTISNPQQFSGKHVMISSNNRVGIEWALTLENIAKKIYLVNSKKKFQHATDDELNRLSDSSIIVKLESDLQKLHGKQGWLERISLKSNEQIEELKIDHLLTYNGLTMIPAPFESWGLITEDNRVVVDHHMATNVDGIFAAGDSTSYPGKKMLISTGYTEGLTAVTSAKKYIEPKAPGLVYSTVIYRK